MLQHFLRIFCRSIFGAGSYLYRGLLQQHISLLCYCFKRVIIVECMCKKAQRALYYQEE